MHYLDLFALIMENLSRRKGRVVLTAIGVLIGTASVVVLVSLGIGLQRGATQLFGIADLTRIDVSPKYNFEGGGGAVLVGGGGGGGGGAVATPVPITDRTIADIQALPGVKDVIPRDYVQAQTILRAGRLEAGAGLMGVGTDDLAKMGVEVAQGTTLLEKGTVIIGAQIAQSGFYDPKQRPGQAPPDPPDLLDKQLTVIAIKWSQDGQEIRKNVPLRVAGITRQSGQESDWSVYISMEDATLLSQWAMNRRINRNKDGYQMLVVKAADPDGVLDLRDRIVDLGYEASTFQQFLEPLNEYYLTQQVIFGGVGAISLLVAAIGIANTMTMAILERTREIGLMKAVGATNRDVLSVFLGEAAGIGFVGGLGGVIFGWMASQVVGVLSLVNLASQGGQSPGFFGGPTVLAVETPVWLMAGSLIFATLVGLLSGLYPALRAATLVPVLALKYE
ncbi:MAG: ABC transporter permease [Anaerolineales bacterium]|nr:ABC transporter permease [Anaerolineales bacterium]